MGDATRNHRWSTPTEIFARTVSLDDSEVSRGILADSIIIEPGTRACAMVEGRFLGEIPAGEFTFRDFRDKLQFWRKGQATFLLTRSDVVHLSVNCDGFISADDVPIDMVIHAGAQIDDPVLFMKNLMGPRDEYPVHELAERLRPAVKQEAWVATARLTVDELRGPVIAAKVAQQVVDGIAPAFRRYGIRVVSVEGIVMQPSGMERHWEKVKKNNVEVADERLTNRRLGDDVGIYCERIALLEQLRDVAISNRLDGARSGEELKAAIAQVDKARLLREEEMDQLTEGFEQRKGDRETLRSHVCKVLDINRQQEVAQLRDQVGHALNLAAKNNELELAAATNSVENARWRNEIFREIERAESQRDERSRDLAAKWQRIREAQRQKHDGSWERLLHQQREEAIRTELAIKEAERKRRVELLEAEAAAQISAQRIIAERQRREFEVEMGARESDAQFTRLKQVQDMNFDAHARQTKLDSELRREAEERIQVHEIERLKTLGTLSAEALIAVSSGDNAHALAELKMQEARSQGDVAAAAAAAAAGSAIAAQAGRNAEDEERRRLTERLLEAEKARADAIAGVFQQALKGQQDAVAQMIGGLAAAHSPSRPPSSSSPVAGHSAEWHVATPGGHSGPYTLQQIQTMIQKGGIAFDSHVWKAGMAGWVAVAECPDFAEVFAAMRPPPPLRHP